MSEAQAAYGHGHIRLSRREAGLSVATLLAIGGLLAPLVLHSKDSDSAVVQRVAATESAIKALQDDRDTDRADQQQFRAEVLQHLNAIDGRTIDTYHVLLDMQQHQPEAHR